MSNHTPTEKQILNLIKHQVNPNVKLQRHLRILKYFWVAGGVLLILSSYFLYSNPQEAKSIEDNYEALMCLPVVLVVILIILGLHIQTIKLIEFHNKSKFKQD